MVVEDAVEDSVPHFAYRACQIVEPQTMEEALSSDHAKEWKEAADSEYESLIENETWEHVELPSGRKPIGCKWVFKVKHRSNGKVEQFKGCLVAKGYDQKYGIDYDETFSPVVRFSSIRALIALAVQNGMLLHQMDVVTAFLNGKLDEEIYMQQPKGYIRFGEEHLVCKLKKSLYGLKQSPRCWNKVFQEYLESIGFKQNTADPCVFCRTVGTMAVIAVYVDDLILSIKTSQEMQEAKESLQARFKMKDMGKLHYCLGISIEQEEDEKCVWIHQKQYILSIIEKYGLTDAKTSPTPADLSVKLEKDDGFSKEVDPIAYQSMVGSLLYAAIATRPDISYAVGVVSKFNSKPTEAHLTAVKRIVRYLKGTVDMGLRYHKSENGILLGYSDADWAGDMYDRHSTTGNLFLMAGGAISWVGGTYKQYPYISGYGYNTYYSLISISPFHSPSVPSTLLQSLPVSISLCHSPSVPSSPLQSLPVSISPCQSPSVPSTLLQSLPLSFSPFQSPSVPSTLLQSLSVSFSLCQSPSAPSSLLQSLSVSFSPCQSFSVPASLLQSLPVSFSPSQPPSVPPSLLQSLPVSFSPCQSPSAPFSPCQSPSVPASLLQSLPVSFSTCKSPSIQSLSVSFSPCQSLSVPSSPCQSPSVPASLLQSLPVSSSPCQSPSVPLSLLQSLPVSFSPCQSPSVPASLLLSLQVSFSPCQSPSVPASLLRSLPVSFNPFQSPSVPSSLLQSLPVSFSPYQSPSVSLPVDPSVPASLLQSVLVSLSPYQSPSFPTCLPQFPSVPISLPQSPPVSLSPCQSPSVPTSLPQSLQVSLSPYRSPSVPPVSLSPHRSPSVPTGLPQSPQVSLSPHRSPSVPTGLPQSPQDQSPHTSTLLQYPQSLLVSIVSLGLHYHWMKL